eukprot:TRINITY_DN9954_c0_g1_i1.p2 TRINITY_DN9954_c0_g1~~TRINITY_DN9954_c0_g1_i1.p2  ORF type:complete len:370 (+),score=152.39 TRINITY_DN9954_c0_g1_i1:87-1196(+)
MKRVAVVAAAIVAVRGDGHEIKTEKEKADDIVAQAPAYDLTNVTVSLNLVMSAADRANCYNDNGIGLWNRTVFRQAAGQAFNALSEIQQNREAGREGASTLINGNWATEYPITNNVPAFTLWMLPNPYPWRPNIYDNIVFDRVVESSRPFLDTVGVQDAHLFAKNASDPAQVGIFPTDFWNVMIRVTFRDVPTAVVTPSAENPMGFRSFGAVLMNAPTLTTSGSYRTATRCPNAELVTKSLWVSTEEHFLPDRLEPVVGRGRKDQGLLIPLLMGIALMLIGPMGIVALLVSAAQQQNETAAKLKKKEEEATKKERAVSGLNERIHAFQNTEEAKSLKRAEEKAREDRERAYEIDAQDCGGWVKQNEPFR